MSDKTNICPGCSARMTLSGDGKKWICEYCGTEVLISAESSLDDSRFDIVNDPARFIDRVHSMESYSHMLYCLNNLGNTALVEQHIRSSLLNDEDVAAMGINQGRIDDVMPRITSVMESGERVLVYGDNGLFARGKDCFLVTDKRSIFVKKKSVRTVCHRDIDSIRFNGDTSYPGWWLNNNMDQNITPVGNKYQLQGAIVAMICMLAWEGNADYNKIKLI